MAKKVKHEEHANHEAWAIPYGDLVTLLLALFVVMYSMSSVNEGKYRVLADSLNAAFGGTPRSPTPINIGEKAQGAASGEKKPQVLPGAPPRPGFNGAGITFERPQIAGPVATRYDGAAVKGSGTAQLRRMADDVQKALGDLIDQDLVMVHKHENWLEVEIKADILFTSGSAQLGDAALPVVDRLAAVLQPFDNTLRIEGHTDDRPIATSAFPSNWELSSARAASVVHRFMGQGVDPRRMTVLGMASFHPVADNAHPEGRNRNRRVVIIVLSTPDDPARPALPAQDPQGAGHVAAVETLVSPIDEKAQP